MAVFGVWGEIVSRWGGDCWAVWGLCGVGMVTEWVCGCMGLPVWLLGCIGLWIVCFVDIIPGGVA